MTIEAYQSIDLKETYKTERPWQERFFEKVRITDGCWEWIGAIGNFGYGRFGFQRRVLYAHRFIFEAKNGPVGRKLDLDHLCRNRACVNPGHLEPVTRKVNNERMQAAKRARRMACQA